MIKWPWIKWPWIKWLWIQILLFNLIWTVGVLGGNPFIVLGISALILHFWLTPTRVEDLMILPLAFIGIAVDLTLISVGVFSFDTIPWWLAIIWFAFVLSFEHSLKFLRNLNWYFLVILGAAGGTWSYLAGWKLGAVELPLGWEITAIVVAVCWSVLLPALVKLDEILRAKVVRI